MSVSTPTSHGSGASENCSPAVRVTRPDRDHQHARAAIRPPQRHVGADGDEPPGERDAEVADAAAAGRQPLGVAREGKQDHPQHERGDPDGKEGEPHYERPSFTRKPASGKRPEEVPHPRL